jgi:hypothetical protein
MLGRLCDRASALDFAVMILLPPITREEDVIPAIDLLSRGEAIVVVASFRRPENLSEEIVWQADGQGSCVPKSSQKQLRCVRRKSDAEVELSKMYA